MPSHPDPDHPVRRVHLPSGKSVEVVYVDDLLDDFSVPAAAAPPRPVSHPMHVCTACASELVYPVRWEEAGPAHWEVELRCPNCETRTTGTFGQEAVERLDEHLDDGTDVLLRDLRRLATSNMGEEIERLVAAIDAGFILPEDF